MLKVVGREVHILFVCQLGEERSKYMGAICNEIAKEYGLSRIAFVHSSPYKVRRFLKKTSYDLIMATDDVAEKVRKILEDIGVNTMFKVVDKKCIESKECVKNLIIESLVELNIISKG